MRRLIIFVVVLALGTALLWHFEKRRRQTSVRRDDVRVVDRHVNERDLSWTPPPKDGTETTPGPGGATDTPPPQAVAGNGQPDGPKSAGELWPGERVEPRSEFSYQRPAQEEGEPRILITAQDTRVLNDAGTKYELVTLEIRSFEVDGAPQGVQPLRSLIQAKTAQFDLKVDKLGVQSLGEELDGVMFDVVVEQYLGSPLTPLTLEAPRLRGRLAIEELRSVDDDLVEFRSRDMRGSGRGLIALAGAESLAFHRGADVSVDLGDGRRVRIITTDHGALTIVDETPDGDFAYDGPNLVRIQAHEGVELIFQSATEFNDLDGSEPATTVEAASIDILLAIDDDDESPLIRTARADGAVTIRHGRDVYRGNTARLLFDGPSMTRVVLEDSPRLTYILRDVDGTEMMIEVTGQGPLTGHLVSDAPPDAAPEDETSDLRFVFVGPAVIEAKDRGATVTFENEARGQGVEGQSAGTILLSGDVRVVTLEGTLQSESILATFEADEDIRFVSEGPTRLVSRSGAVGEQYRILAGGGLAAHLVAGNWFIDSALDFHGEASGVDPHRVDAASVTDVDIAARTLKANGVRYQSLWGEVTAAETLVRGDDSIRLTGSIDAPVVLDLAPEGAALVAESEQMAGVRTGFVSAVSLTLRENSFQAEGRVAAEFETAEGVWAFDADTLSVHRVILVGEAEAAVEAGTGALQHEQADELRIEASFVREARFDGPGSRAWFQGQRITLRGVILDAGDGPAGGRSQGSGMDPDREVTVDALGEVKIVLESVGADPETLIGRWTLHASTAQMIRGQRELGGAGGTPFNLVASQVTQCVYEAKGRRAELTADEVEIDATLGAPGRPIAELEAEEDGKVSTWGSSLVAKGRVDMSYTNGPTDPTIRGRGHLLLLLDGERGRLDALDGKRVRVTGRLPGDKVPYTLTAKTVWFTDVELRADTPTIRLSRSLSLKQFAGIPIDEISADTLVANENTLTLEGRGRTVGKDGKGFDFTKITVDVSDLKEPAIGPRETLGPFAPVPQQESEPPADEPGGWEVFGLKGPFLGFQVKSDRIWMNAEVGFVIEGSPAHMERDGTSVDTEFLKILFDDYLIFAGRGAIRAPGRTPGEVMTFEFGAIDSRIVGKDILITISAPVIAWGAESARADYLALFIDRERWRAKGDSIRRKTKMPSSFSDDDTTARSQPNFLAQMLFELQSQEYGQYIRALYMEGGIEISRADKRAVKGSKLYIDLQHATAWIEDVEIVYPLTTRGKQVPLRIRTERLETDHEGRLVAEGATLTTCDHDDPHFVVRTKLFALEPRGDGRWRFSAKGNRLIFQGGIAMPLPSIGNVVLDEDFGVEGFENEAGEVTPLRDIGIGKTARFGTTLGAAFRFDIGKVGTWIAERLGMDGSKLRGKWDADARYLWDRGPLLGLGLQIREHEPGDDPDEDFRVDTFIGGIADDGEDVGTIRAPTDERDTLRLFGYVRSRYPIVRGEWIDFAFASQTDAAVQSEFYENDYLTFEQRDTFVRWRKSFGADYLTAGVQKRVDSFRSQKEELPSFYAYRGERRVGSFTGLPVLWGGHFEAAYLKRTEGDPGDDLFSDLPGGADLGIGDGEAARADISQRVSIPIRTNVAAIRATPFAEFRGTAWSDSLDGTDDPLRGAVQAGIELSTTLHKVTDNGFLHAIAPRVSVRTDVWYDESGGTLIPFDQTEDPIDGTAYEAGVRMLWQRPATFENLDIDLRTILRQDRENGLEDTSEFAALAEYITQFGSGGRLIGFRHDARYDLETTQTNYSRSTFAVRPAESWLVEFSYAEARAITREELYENTGVRLRWTVDPKWEIEAGYTHDLKESRQLLSELILRRFSHDFVLDIGFQDRAGEGVSFGFRFSPLIGWERGRLGMLDR